MNSNNRNNNQTTSPPLNQNTEYLTNAILEEMVRQLRMEQNTTPPSPPPRNRHIRNSEQNRSNNNRNLDIFNDMLDTMYETITQYNENMSEYNRNVRQAFNYLHNAQNYCIANNFNIRPRSSGFRIGNPPINQDQQRWSGEPNTHTRFPENRNTRFSQQRQSPNRRVESRQHTFGNNNRMFFSYAFNPFQPQNNENSENVRPMTREEISRTTRTFSYTRDSLPEDRRTCPITMEQFQPGDVLCEILGCHHIFRRPALMNWLQRSSLCPVCRYTINSYQETTSTAANTNPNPNTSNTTTNENNSNPFSFHLDSPATENTNTPTLPGLNEFQEQLNTNISNILNTELLSSNPNIDLSLNISRFSIPTTSSVQPLIEDTTTETNNNNQEQQQEEVSDIEDNIPVD